MLLLARWLATIAVIVVMTAFGWQVLFAILDSDTYTEPRGLALLLAVSLILWVPLSLALRYVGVLGTTCVGLAAPFLGAGVLWMASMVFTADPATRSAAAWCAPVAAIWCGLAFAHVTLPLGVLTAFLVRATAHADEIIAAVLRRPPTRHASRSRSSAWALAVLDAAILLPIVLLLQAFSWTQRGQSDWRMSVAIASVGALALFLLITLLVRRRARTPRPEHTQPGG